MRNGVTIINPNSTHISADAVIGSDTVLLPGVIIEGKTVIGEDCKIGPDSHIVDSQIGNATTIQRSVVLNSQVGIETVVAPFAHLRAPFSLGQAVMFIMFTEV